MVTLIGLGSDPDDMTLAARNAVERASFVAVKTLKTKVCRNVKSEVNMDDLFDKCEDFDSLNSAIVDRLVKLDNDYGDVAYCTDGSGLTDGVLAELKKRNIGVKIIRGVDMGPKVYCDSNLKLTAYRAIELKPYIDSSASVEITEIDDKFLAGDIKLYLLEFFAPDKKVLFCYGNDFKEIELENIDREKNYDRSVSVYIEGDTSLSKGRYSFGDLMRLMSRLTAPDGCPWDKVQTHESIRSNMIEEAYEAVDAIDSGDIEAMREEIGDVLMQAVFHCDMASRTGEFTAGDVISELCGKLYFRHTHIFGRDRATDAGEALKFWENAKAVEKQYTSLYDILTRLPKGFPSLLRAQKAYKKALKADKESAAEKIEENELAAKLFELVKRAAVSGLDCETVLNKATEKYIEGFKE